MGAVLNVRITSPTEGQVLGYIKIYDVVGNLVNYSIKQDILAAAQAKGINTKDVTTLRPGLLLERIGF